MKRVHRDNGLIVEKTGVYYSFYTPDGQFVGKIISGPFFNLGELGFQAEQNVYTKCVIELHERGLLDVNTGDGLEEVNEVLRKFFSKYVDGNDKRG